MTGSTRFEGPWPVTVGAFQALTEYGMAETPAFLAGRWAIHADEREGGWVVSLAALGIRLPFCGFDSVVEALSLAVDIEPLWTWDAVHPGPQLGQVIGAPSREQGRAIRRALEEKGWDLPAPDRSAPAAVVAKAS